MKAKWKSGNFDGMYDNEELYHKKSEATRVAWARGDYGKEWRYKLSEATKARWERGDFDNHSEVVKAAWERGIYDNHSEAMKAAWERGCFDGVFQSPTSIELQVAAALDIMGIEHQPQYRPDGYSRIYDEFVLPNTLIEVQGDYFHSEEHFPGIGQRDIEKAQWAADNGFNLIIIWGHEIKEQGAWAVVMEMVGGL